MNKVTVVIFLCTTFMSSLQAAQTKTRTTWLPQSTKEFVLKKIQPIKEFYTNPRYDKVHSFIWGVKSHAYQNYYLDALKHAKENKEKLESRWNDMLSGKYKNSNNTPQTNIPNNKDIANNQDISNNERIKELEDELSEIENLQKIKESHLQRLQNDMLSAQYRNSNLAAQANIRDPKDVSDSEIIKSLEDRLHQINTLKEFKREQLKRFQNYAEQKESVQDAPRNIGFFQNLMHK